MNIDIGHVVEYVCLSGKGHHSSLSAGDLPGPYSMATPLVDTTDVCFEFYHRSTSGDVSVLVEDEDLRKTVLHTDVHQPDWTRVKVNLPAGRHRIIISGTGSGAMFAVDDVISMPCSQFGRTIPFTNVHV